LIIDVGLPAGQQPAVIKAVRWISVYRAVMVNMGTLWRFAGGAVWFGLAVTTGFTALARPEGPGQWVPTWLGVTGGLILTFAIPIGLLTVALTKVIRRWPQTTRPAHQVFWSLLFTTAVLATVYASGRPPGFRTALLWGIPAGVLAIGLPDLALTWSIMRWHNSHYRKGAPERAYRKWLALRNASAAEQLLRATAILTGHPAAWRTPAGYATLTGKLTLTAQQAFQAHRQLARGSRWTARGRDHNRVVLAECFRLRQAIFGLRDALATVTRQEEYDALTGRARDQMAALAGNDWDVLPACPVTRSAAASLAATFSACTLTFASGVAVNAVSEHLPEPMKQQPVAVAAGLAAIVAATVFTWRRLG
jgi:hypothetical protein